MCHDALCQSLSVGVLRNKSFNMRGQIESKQKHGYPEYRLGGMGDITRMILIYSEPKDN